MSHHTPGPWNWVGYSLMPVNPDHTKHAVHTIAQIESFSTSFVGQDLDTALAEDKANRRLIAAAPDLLEAVEYAIKQVPELATVPGIRDAIAKVEGK